MDIWDWVEGTTERLREGDVEQQRLAKSMRELPTATCDDEHERVDTLVPEAVALARRLGETWVELFLRHWNLQSRVLHRNLARSEELREAVDLLEFANRPDTQRCPQSVCVTQDLACCYSKADGPGYVAERLAVAAETLGRIDPSWPCFDCISAEYFSALMDDQRASEGLAFLDRQQAKLAEHGIFKPGSNMVHNRADALLALGRPADALAVLEGVRDPARLGESYAMHHRMIRVKALLGLDRADEAEVLHPEFAAIVATASHYEDWVLGLRGLIKAGRVANDAGIGEQLLTLQRNLEHNGSRWDAADVAANGAELAIDRGARAVAGLLLADVRRLRGLLRRPAVLDARIVTIEQRLAELPEPTLPESPTIEAIEAILRGPEDEGLPTERALDVIAAARAALPEDATLAVHEARVLRQLARPEVARARLTHLLDRLLATPGEREPDTLAPVDALVAELAAASLEDHDFVGFDGLLARFDVVGDARADRELVDGPLAARVLGHLHRLRAESLQMRGEPAAAERAFRALLDAGLAGAWARLRLAELARVRGDWPTVLEELDQAIDDLEPGSPDWQRMTAATLLGRWDVVRHSMERLGLPSLDLPDAQSDRNAPIETDLGVVRCEFVEPDGSKPRYWTRRTSPCSGRVLELAFPDDTQHYGDLIVYEPTDLDADDEDEDHPLCFAVVAVVEPGGHRSFVVRGWDPGEQGFDALMDALGEEGFPAERITAPGRTGRDPRVSDEDDVEIPTVALLIAVEADRGDAGIQALRDCLHRATSGWELPLLSPELEAAAGDSAACDAAIAMLARMQT
jgi:tetratricopeptide (TPR) repeat protein